MPLWLQHLLVLALVAFALVVVIRQAVATLRLKGGKIGSCCAKGCSGAASTHAKPAGERIVFLPAESLLRRKR
jgi:hypothetical protein